MALGDWLTKANELSGARRMAGAGRMLGGCRCRKLPGPSWPPRPCLTGWTSRPTPRPARRWRARPARPGGGWRRSAACGPRCWPGSGPGPQRDSAGGGQGRLGGDAGRNGGFCTASLSHDEANGCSGCAPSTGSARMRARHNPPVSSAAGRMPLATARHAGMKPSPTVPGDRRVLQAPEAPGHASERFLSARRWCPARQPNRRA